MKFRLSRYLSSSIACNRKSPTFAGLSLYQSKFTDWLNSLGDQLAARSAVGNYDPSLSKTESVVQFGVKNNETPIYMLLSLRFTHDLILCTMEYQQVRFFINVNLTPLRNFSESNLSFTECYRVGSQAVYTLVSVFLFHDEGS